MIPTFLRFADLKARGIVRNRVTLKKLQDNCGFPIGMMLGPNSRVWTEAEIEEWLASRPTERTLPLPNRWRKAECVEVA